MQSGGGGGGGGELSGLFFCPSFNSYSSDRLANIAQETALEEEGRKQQEEEQMERREEQSKRDDREEHEEEEEKEDDFEFISLARDVDDPFVISSDRIGPVFPVFNRDLLFENGFGIDGRELKSNSGGGGAGSSSSSSSSSVAPSIRIPLKDLFVEDQDPPSHSSSEADELEGIPEGSYCVWTPRASVPSSPSWCKKSNSTGSRSSRRWRIRDLLRRSNSDGKDSFVFLTPSSKSKGEAKVVKERRSSSGDGNTGKSSANAAAEEKKVKSASALEVFYTRNKVAIKDGGNRRKSYLPYRQDLVGFFANFNNFGRTFPPFG